MNNKAKIAIILSLFAILFTIVFFVTPYGASTFQSIAQNNKDASWSPDLQWRAASTYQWWGDFKGASEAFANYYKTYPKNEEKCKEAEFHEIIALYNGLQYQTCQEKVDSYLEKYEEDEENEHYEKVEKKQHLLSIMPQGQKINNPW